VLSNGENVEPQPIEDAIVGTSALVDQAMLVGQDQNYLSAFIVVNPAELARRGNKALCTLLALLLCLRVKESDAIGQLLHFSSALTQRLPPPPTHTHTHTPKQV
jgi:hypothetical protein